MKTYIITGLRHMRLGGKKCVETLYYLPDGRFCPLAIGHAARYDSLSDALVTAKRLQPRLKGLEIKPKALSLPLQHVIGGTP